MEALENKSSVCSGRNKFGEQKQHAEIETFLMSCRIIGRNIEFSFIDYLMNSLLDNKIETVKAKYIKSQKNEMVTSFFDKSSFIVNNSSDVGKEYTLELYNYKPKAVSYIEVKYG